MKPVEYKQLVLESRSTRRFNGGVELLLNELRELVDLARTTPSSMNRQPLKYCLISEQETRDQVFSCLSWAKALEDWVGPDRDERPGGYIVILGDKTLSDNYSCDHGIVAQTIMLGTRCRGYGGCIIASIDRDRLREILKIDKRFDILLLLALGEPNESVVIEPIPDDGSVDYWRDEASVHHVPKRSLDDIIVGEY